MKAIEIDNESAEFIESLGSVFAKYTSGDVKKAIALFTDIIFTEYILSHTKLLLSEKEFHFLCRFADIDRKQFYDEAIKIVNTRPFEFESGEPDNPDWNDYDEIKIKEIIGQDAELQKKRQEWDAEFQQRRERDEG